ncbi:PREDICTED: WD repeat-containing protein 34-like, partial [Priapulus caudatus]|uniref:WD repeat-containing protein 34-like n=1 Tax=Priapulus caudatus TaxID=37621 RepID=A0ABM1DZ00_PRICU
MSMLNDSSIEGESFSSSWKRTRSVVEASSQTKTNNNPTRDKSYQSIKKNSVEVQTEDLFDTYSNLPETVPSGLPEFLARVEPLVTKELRKNITSQAFNGYDVSWAAVHKAVSCVHTLQNVDFQKEQMECTGLSWNCVGSVIAAIYGRHDHEDWCTHKGAFCMWNIDRPHLNPGKPDFVMETPACMTSIAFHPTEPTLIAGGYFNGEVVVWNLGLDEDTQLAASDENSHREPVTQVQWIIDPKSRVIAKYHLVSVSSDGKMLRWQVPVRKQNLKLLDGFMLLGKNNVDVLKMKESEANREVGVTSVSFSPTDKSSFSLGSENGGIFLCSLNDTGTPITGSGIDSELMSLVTTP